MKYRVVIPVQVERDDGFGIPYPSNLVIDVEAPHQYDAVMKVQEILTVALGKLEE